MFSNSDAARSASQLVFYLEHMPYGQMWFGVSVGAVNDLWVATNGFLSILGLSIDFVYPDDSMVFTAKLGWPYLTLLGYSFDPSTPAYLNSTLSGKLITFMFYWHCMS
jgi:hypothetical protein